MYIQLLYTIFLVWYNFGKSILSKKVLFRKWTSQLIGGRFKYFNPLFIFAYKGGSFSIRPYACPSISLVIFSFRSQLLSKLRNTKQNQGHETHTPAPRHILNHNHLLLPQTPSHHLYNQPSSPHHTLTTTNHTHLSPPKNFFFKFSSGFFD